MSTAGLPALEQIPGMEESELAVAILRSLSQTGTSFRDLVERCFGPDRQQHDEHPAVERLSDAWASLVAHGYIGPTCGSDTAYRITARGRIKAQHGLRSNEEPLVDEGLSPLRCWWRQTPEVDTFILVLVGGSAWVVTVCLGGLAGIWFVPLSVTALVAAALALPAAPLRRLLAAIEDLVSRRVDAVVTLSTFSAAAALVAFAMVATVASPDLRSALDVVQGGFTELIGQPIAWGLWIVPAALQTIGFVLITDALPMERVRLRRALAASTAAGLVLLLALFGVLAQQLALLALLPFVER